MSGLASKLISALFKKASTRKAAPLRRAALGMEQLDLRAVLSTVLPTTTADDVVVDGPIITGENFDSARSGGGAGGGMGGGKVSMQDFHFVMRNNAASGHPGGVNVLFGDGSVRFVRDSVALPPGDLSPDTTAVAPARTVASGGGVGKVSMRDFDGIGSSEEVDPVEIIVSAGGGAPGGHVKVFNGAGGGELASFFAFGGFNGGVRVASADVGGDNAGDSGHGTHVAGTIGAVPPATGGAGTPTGQVRFFDSSANASHATGALRNIGSAGAYYRHADLYQNIWINQTLEDVIDVLARDASRHG